MSRDLADVSLHAVTNRVKRKVYVGKRVILVPYAPHHVPRFNEWLKDPELRYLTASEEIPLDEHYDVQRRWQFTPALHDFIILDKVALESELLSLQGTEADAKQSSTDLGQFDVYSLQEAVEGVGGHSTVPGTRTTCSMGKFVTVRPGALEKLALSEISSRFAIGDVSISLAADLQATNEDDDEVATAEENAPDETRLQMLAQLANDHDQQLRPELSRVPRKDVEGATLAVRCGELGVMIADPQYRRKGYAHEAVSIIINEYGPKVLSISRFVVKLVQSNCTFEGLGSAATTAMALSPLSKPLHIEPYPEMVFFPVSPCIDPSMRFFLRLGFRPYAVVPAFEEVHMVLQSSHEDELIYMPIGAVCVAEDELPQ